MLVEAAAQSRSRHQVQSPTLPSPAVSWGAMAGQTVSIHISLSAIFNLPVAVCKSSSIFIITFFKIYTQPIGEPYQKEKGMGRPLLGHFLKKVPKREGREGRGERKESSRCLT